MLTEAKRKLRQPLLPVARVLAGRGVTPDLLTAAGLLAAVFSGIAIVFGHIFAAILGLVASGLCDLLDGDVARQRPGRDRRFGAFFDSTSDRVTEICLFGGLLLNRVRLETGPTLSWTLAWLLALTGGLLVSYTRARAEGLGIACRVGVADRSVRVGLIVVMLIAGLRHGEPFLWVLAALSWITVIQRAVHVRRAVSGAAG
jgi:CDP-diacylglycerol---glycerol-3-phosphate 3-phosphatidyltransferase